MESLKPDARACKTPPLEPWITEKDLAKAGGKQENSDVDSIISGSRAFSDVLETHSKVSDMLNEECAHLLRKAQTALSKSAKA